MVEQTPYTFGGVSALVTYRERNHRGRLVRRVEQLNLIFNGDSVTERALRSELVDAIKTYGFAASFDQCDVYTGGRHIRSYVRR